MAGGKSFVVDAWLDERPRLAMTPMIDIIFQLLIFFMFAMKFASGEGFLQSCLPADRGIVPNRPVPLVVQEVRVKLLWADRGDWSRLYRRPQDDPDGRRGMTVLKVGGRYLMRGAGPSAVPDWDGLVRLLRRKSRQYLQLPASMRQQHPTQPVIIEAYRMVPFQEVVSALNAAIKAGVTDITFAAPQKDF